MKVKEGRKCRRCQSTKEREEFGFIYCIECETDLDQDKLIKSYGDRLCIGCSKKIKQPRSEYCIICYEKKFDIKAGGIKYV